METGDGMNNMNTGMRVRRQRGATLDTSELNSRVRSGGNIIESNDLLESHRHQQMSPETTSMAKATMENFTMQQQQQQQQHMNAMAAMYAQHYFAQQQHAQQQQAQQQHAQQQQHRHMHQMAAMQQAAQMYSTSPPTLSNSWSHKPTSYWPQPQPQQGHHRHHVSPPNRFGNGGAFGGGRSQERNGESNALPIGFNRSSQHYPPITPERRTTGNQSASPQTVSPEEEDEENTFDMEL
jgi:hypothetical protein